jgi:hypothetical protein
VPLAGPVVAGTHSVAGLEQPAEVGRVRVPPAGADGRDGPGHPARVAQVVAAVLESALPDPSGHGGAAGVEQLVQLAERDVVGRRDLGRRQVGLAQVFLDERGYPQHQRAVRGVRIGRRAVQPFGEHGAEQVEYVARQPEADLGSRGIRVVQQVSDLSEERPDQRGQAARLARQPGRGQLGQPGLRQAQHVPGEDQDQHAVRVAERERVRAVGVVQGEVAGGQGRFPAVLDQHRAAAQLQADLVTAGRRGLDQAGRPAGGVRVGEDLDEAQAAELAAAEPAAEVAVLAGTADLERDERVRQDVLPVFEPLPGRQVKRPGHIGHSFLPPSLGCPSLRAGARMVKGCAR